MHISVFKKRVNWGIKYYARRALFGCYRRVWWDTVVWFLAAYPDVKVTAIDRDELAIAAAKERLLDHESDRLSFLAGEILLSISLVLYSFDGNYCGFWELIPLN